MKSLQWYHLYYILALLDLTAVCSSQYVSFRIMAIYADSVAVNQAWAARLDGYARLSSLASAVNAPGNDVFDSRDVAGESLRMEKALAAFNAQAATLAQADRREENLSLSPIMTTMDEMLQEARSIFSYFKEKDTRRAGRRMASMDRKYAKLREALAAAETRVRTIQRRHLRAQQAAAEASARYELVVAALTLLMAAGAVFYGRRMVREMADAQREKERGQELLRRSEKMSAIGQLAAGVAHEINNPLGVILGFSQSLARRLKAGDEIELPIKSIEREALRCKALVQSLLTFARTQQSDRIPMDLNEAVEQALTLISPQAKIGRVTVETALAADLPKILGNKHQIEQVIMNLAKNAIDAMPGGGALTLTSELVSGVPHSWILLKVVDDGAGIPPAVAAKIFDPFFTTKPIGQGTGLGLSLVSEIVEKHSGEVSVESRPGRTAFTVKLPSHTGGALDWRAEELRAQTSAERGSGAETKGSVAHG
ncbi:MAG: hypothetical protein HY923_01600 [Elusimicrobia bacterium]|nr:hypothetical protein [Elusimicrobiota bacterium]